MFLYIFSSWIPEDLAAKFELPTQLRSVSKVCGGGSKYYIAEPKIILRSQRLYGVERDFSDQLKPKPS